MSNPFPRSPAELAGWAERNGVSSEEARLRFVQFVVLCGIASILELRESLVFKGGNALDFVWQPNRSTKDLDFSLDMVGARFEANPDSILNLLKRGLTIATQQFGIVFLLTKVEKQPPGQEATFVTYTARVGYAFRDETRLLVRMANGFKGPHVLPIEISINEPIGASTRFTLDSRFQPLRVGTLEDIVAEKLRSLLQQSIRNRYRRQDVLDIAVIVQSKPDLDLEKISSFLQTKAAARNVPVSSAAFRANDVAKRAHVDYEALKNTTRSTFVPFDEAFALVLNLVDRLSIPDS